MGPGDQLDEALRAESVAAAVKDARSSGVFVEGLRANCAIQRGR